MKSIWIKKNWPYHFLLFSTISAILAINNYGFIFKSGTAGIGMVILLLLNFKKVKPTKDVWMIIIAFLFSIAGDWYLSHKNGNPIMFSKGIALFFLAHLGYLAFALLNGKVKWLLTSAVLIVFLVYFFVILYPTFSDKVLMIASLIYLLISCLSFGASFGVQGDSVVKWTYVFGVFLILFSDTMISLTEFLKYPQLDFLILPTYYLAHIVITFSIIRKVNFTNYNS
ncbi:MAG: lysoplasmalogenase [Flavobacteriales bacterium]|nr:lysoplasmalogenase [Flavobacteriales bacterium]